MEETKTIAKDEKSFNLIWVVAFLAVLKLTVWSSLSWWWVVTPALIIIVPVALVFALAIFAVLHRYLSCGVLNVNRVPFRRIKGSFRMKQLHGTEDYTLSELLEIFKKTS